MIIRKQPPRPHALGEPILHENHKRPVTRREMLGAGLVTAPAVLMAPAWLGALLRSGTANALSNDIQGLAQGACGLIQGGGGKSLPFICFDLAGGANLVGSEVLVGVKGGQSNFLSTAGYGKLGLPGNMVPSSSANISSALGLLWHADGGILRGILSKATTAATAAGTNGAVICAMSQNDTGNNPHNPMYGIAKAQTTKGQLLELIGSQSTVSGGNSVAPMALIDPTLQPTKISQPADATGLVDTGGASADPVIVAALESESRISYNGTGGVLANAGLKIYPSSTTMDAAAKTQLQCQYVKSAYTTDAFGNPANLDPTQDANITGTAGGAPIFTATDFKDGDVAKTATVMKLVLNGYAGAGTVSLGGFDYHDSTRATGEQRNFKAGQMIGAVLEYAQRVKSPVMIYVFSDGSLSATSTPDSSTNGRGKLGWQGDNQSTASTFFLVYSPNGRPTPTNGAASQQIGYFTADGSVVTTSSPAGNSVTNLVWTVILNYMSMLGTAGNFATTFPMQTLGTAASGLTVFGQVV
jgi:hypothetical protein